MNDRRIFFLIFTNDIVYSLQKLAVYVLDR